MTFKEGIINAFPNCDINQIIFAMCPFDFYGADAPAHSEDGTFCNDISATCHNCWGQEMDIKAVGK